MTYLFLLIDHHLANEFVYAGLMLAAKIVVWVMALADEGEEDLSYQ